MRVDAPWKEDPVAVKRWLLEVMRQTRQVGVSNIMGHEHAVQRARAIRIPGDVVESAFQLMALDLEADRCFRQWESQGR